MKKDIREEIKGRYLDEKVQRDWGMYPGKALYGGYLPKSGSDIVVVYGKEEYILE